MAYRIDSISDNCYPDTTVLINKYDVRDEQQFVEVETLVVSARAAQLEKAPIKGY